jgi:hypothetical protein
MIESSLRYRFEFEYNRFIVVAKVEVYKSGYVSISDFVLVVYIVLRDHFCYLHHLIE